MRERRNSTGQDAHEGPFENAAERHGRKTKTSRSQAATGSLTQR
jgi:hypothetical protein